MIKQCLPLNDLLCTLKNISYYPQQYSEFLKLPIKINDGQIQNQFITVLA